LDLGIEAAGAGGYARELTEDERAEQQKRLEEAITGFDVVITTALVPGRKAPTLVTAAAVQGMKAGSVVVDLAGSRAELRADRTGPDRGETRRDDRVAAEPAGDHAEHASELYSRNISSLLELMIDGRAGWCRTTPTRFSPSPVWRASRVPTPAPATRAREARADGIGSAGELGDPGVGRLHRLLGDLQGAEHTAYAADVGYERHSRHRAARRDHRAGPGR